MSETLGTKLERARLRAKERRLERAIAHLTRRARAREAARLDRVGVERAAAEFTAELEGVRARLSRLGDDRDQPSTGRAATG